jgi:hypothetical protein
MMIATNWGVYEIGLRAAAFVEPGDTRELQVRARLASHLDALRERIPGLGETIFLDGIADFPYRAYIARDVLGMGLWDLAFNEVTYERFKEGAHKSGDHKLHGLLSRMWTAWLDTYPAHSSYTKNKATRPHQELDDEPRGRRLSWYEDIETDAQRRRRNGL